MKLIERIKISWQGSEETASLAALLSIPFILPIVAFLFVVYFQWYEENTLNVFKTIGLVIGFLAVSYGIFKIIHVIVNSFYHSINHDYFKNRLGSDSGKNLGTFLLAIPLSIMALFELGRLFAFISKNASENPVKSAIIYFGLAFLVIIAYFLRKTIKKLLTKTYEDINGFLFSQDDIKSIPALLTIITVAIFGALIVASAKAHSLEPYVGNDLTYLALGIVVVPLIVFLTSGTVIYKIHNKHQANNAFNILLKVCTIISRIILLSLFTLVIAVIVIGDFRSIPKFGALFVIYFGFLFYQIHELKKDFAYIRLFK